MRECWLEFGMLDMTLLIDMVQKLVSNLLDGKLSDVVSTTILARNSHQFDRKSTISSCIQVPCKSVLRLGCHSRAWLRSPNNPPPTNSQHPKAADKTTQKLPSIRNPNQTPPAQSTRTMNLCRVRDGAIPGLLILAVDFDRGTGDGIEQAHFNELDAWEEG